MENYAGCFIIFAFVPQVLSSLVVAPTLLVNVGEYKNITITSTTPLPPGSNITLSSDQDDIAYANPSFFEVTPSQKSWETGIHGAHPGFIVMSVTVESASTKNESYIHVTVSKLPALAFISDAVGWIYLAAWTISFYPQMYTNYVRKSVVGLNFDFVALNLVGFTLYSLYNCGLYFVPYIQGEYFARYPKSLNPVQLNDVLFSVHAALATLVVVAQCIIYEKSGQKVSWTAMTLMLLFFVIIIVTGTIADLGKIMWLDFLMCCSLIKLTITLVKYIPQAVMNYRRKSTVGWSIGNVLLDLTGGSFSMLQMIINSINYDDWISILGDPTKFGLGLFSVCFDFLFIHQHYILYRIRPEDTERIIDDNSDSTVAADEIPNVVEDGS